MTGEPKGRFVGLVLAKAACCGVLLLFLTGLLTLNGVAVWLRDGRLAWPVLAAVFAAGGVFVWRWLRARGAGSDAMARPIRAGRPR
jgi:hypothetical protein